MLIDTMQPEIMKGIPRGLKDKFLKDQKIPMAAWQSPKAMQAHKPFHYDPKNPQGKILIGAIGEQLIGVKDERHVGSCAGSRAGKSTTMTANLFFYNGSVLVIDPKHEHCEHTADARARLGQEVRVVAPYKSSGSAGKFAARYNPLRVLDIASEGVMEDALQIVDAIVITSGDEKEPHWNESASDFLLGLVLYVAFGSNIADKDRNLVTVRRLIKRAKKTFRLDEHTKAYVLEGDVKRGIGHLRDGEFDDIAETIEGCITGFYEKSYDEMAGVLSTTRRHTSWLDHRAIRKSLSGHDFNLRDLKRKKLSIYLCLPATKMKANNRWLRIFINQLVAAMESETSIPDAPVVAMLDEMPVLGHVQALENSVGYLASFHLKLWMVFQDIGQLEAIYKTRWQSFLANVGVMQWFSNVDLKTTEYISKILGKTPVLGLRQGEVSSDQANKGLDGGSQSKELHPLLAPDEVSRVFAKTDPMRRQYLQIAGLLASITQRVEWFNKNAPYAHHFDAVR